MNVPAKTHHNSQFLSVQLGFLSAFPVTNEIEIDFVVTCIKELPLSKTSSKYFFVFSFSLEIAGAKLNRDYR